MTKDEILEKIVVLRQAADSLEEPEKTFKLSDTDQLEIQLQGMAISDVADKMRSISLPDLEAMDANIQAASDATAAHSQRVSAFNRAYDFVKGALGIAL